MEKSPSDGAAPFLPLDYHNLNKHREQTGKMDFKVRGNSNCYYYLCMIESGRGETGKIGEFSPDRHSFSKAVTSFKNSSLMKSVNPLKSEFRVPSRRNESDYFDNPQRTLDHSITQKLFDDMGNIAGSSENNISYYSNQGANFNKADGYTKARATPYATDDSDLILGNSCGNNFRDSDYLYDESGCHKSNRRVAPIYMQNPYEPNSIDRIEI